MSIIRVRRPRQYTSVPDPTLRDSRLRLAALGLLVRLLSRPDGWQVRPLALARECGVGRDTLRALLRSLEECGYLVRSRTRDAAGRWAWQSEVYDTPQPTIAGKSGDGASDDDVSVARKHGDTSTTVIPTTDISITHHHGGGRVPLDAGLSWPRLPAEDRAAAERLLITCPPDRRQPVLDVLTAALKDRIISRSSPIPYLSALIASAGDAPGARLWDPSPGHPIARDRERTRQSRAATTPPSTTTPAVAEAAIESMRSTVRHRRRS